MTAVLRRAQTKNVLTVEASDYEDYLNEQFLKNNNLFCH